MEDEMHPAINNIVRPEASYGGGLGWWWWGAGRGRTEYTGMLLKNLRPFRRLTGVLIRTLRREMTQNTHDYNTLLHSSHMFQHY